MRLASRVRLSQKAKKAESLADDYSIIASLAPFSLERVDGAESAELTLRVGELFLVTLDARTGAGGALWFNRPAITTSTAIRR